MKVKPFQLLTLFALILAATASAQLWRPGGSTPRVFASNSLTTQVANTTQAIATLPNAFSYQGTLRLADGSLANGSFTVTVRLYTVVMAGTPLFEQPFAGVAVRDGVFNVVIGDDPNHVLPAGLFDNSQLFLGITVAPDPEMLPRQRLHPVPWAMQATTAATANALAPEGWTVNALRYIANSRQGVPQRADYPVDLHRFTVEALDAGTTPTSVDVNDPDLVRLCADEDGCEMRLSMRNRDANQAGTDLLTASFPYHFSLGKTANGQRLWRSVGFNDAGAPVAFAGLDGGNGSQNVISAGDCRLTDGFVLDGVDHQDALIGFSVINWFGTYDSPNAVCVLVIND